MPWTRKEAQKCTDFRNAQFMCGHLSNDWRFRGIRFNYSSDNTICLFSEAHS